MSAHRTTGGTRGGRRRDRSTFALFCLAHAAVDATCAGLLFGAVHRGLLAGSTAWAVFIAYNLLAFATQPLVGLVADRLDEPHLVAAGGAIATAAALPVGLLPHGLYAAVAIAGLGNAVFHVGGGIVSLRATPGMASGPGLFVAPGAAGLLAGILAGKAGEPVWPFALVLLALGVALAASPPPVLRPPARRAGARPRLDGGAVELLLVSILLVVAVRSYVGTALAFPWKKDTTLLVTLTAAIVAGKALGGIAADRWGWRRVGVGALLLSLPLLAVGPQAAGAGIAGALIFNATMPVTLAATALALPGHEGFAFGLTCLALIAGALVAPYLDLTLTALVAATALAAVALWLGLGRLLADPAGAGASVSREGPSLSLAREGE